LLGCEPAHQRRSTLARAKDTARAEARRRARAALRAESGADRAEAADATADAEATTAQPARPSAFKLPNFRQDLRDLPRILTSRPAMAVAPFMLALGFVLQLASSRGALPADYGLPIPLVGFMSFLAIGELYIQIFFLPPALLTFFLAGYIAPRASYLVGALLGLLSGIMWVILVATAPLPGDPPLAGEGDVASLGLYLVALNVGYGTFAAAFAAWYRDFLRRMRDQGMARRAQREADERAKRREQRQEDRRALKKAAR
jgi:hypothetical protein